MKLKATIESKLENISPIKRGLISCAFLILISVLIEIFFFNFRSLQSLFYEESDYSQYTVSIVGGHPAEDLENTYYIDDEYAEIKISNIGHEVKNIKADFENLNALDLPFIIGGGCDVIVDSTDEYISGQNTTTTFPVFHTIPASQYIWFISKGNVDNITIKISMNAGYIFKIHDLKLNAHRPILFSSMRCFITFLCVSFLFAMRKRSCLWSEDCITWKGWKKGVIAFIISAFLFTGFYFIQSNPCAVYVDNYHAYQELAWALDAGQVSLLELPDEKLANIENPYDYFNRLDEGYTMEDGNYKFDYVMYEGKYYVYFGIVPCLIFYYPLYHFMGLNMPNSIPVFICCVFFCIGIFFLLLEIIKRFYPKTPFALLLLMQLAMMFGCQIPMFMTQGENYILPIISAITLTVWGLYFWISSLQTEPKKINWKRLLAGSVLMALVAGCRPTTVIYSCLALPIFLPYCKVDGIEYTKKKRNTSICILFIPYIFVAIGLMYYNSLRFGSPFDFGTQYTLTLLNLNGMKFALDRSLAGIYESFLRLPYLHYRFPYIQEISIAPDNFGHGLMFREMLVGGLFPCNLFLFAIAAIYKLRKKNIKKELFLFCNMILFFAFGLVVFTTSYTGCVIYRYLAEFSSLLFLVAFIAIMAMQEQFEGKEYNHLFRKIFVITVILSIMYASCIPFVPELKFPLEAGNTELYYKIFYGFNFW